MKKPAIAMSLLVVLVGCAIKYTHPDYSEQKWAADYAFCSAQSGQATGGRDRTIRDCLIGKGWSKQ